ncbi:MAG: two component, sigma54 specific, transcriptional regulator, Fis family [Bacteroidetes bacterium]|jgi:DNA-binding NtrC family response regulator|nr:two component, sigma54 specific, transcriptional regulator, Fis family [Bacteroidota bacterium]MBP1678414.1 two component, sigma54 specific, transcriptional regulator, Fis family [Bacteroidota bacterium]
MKRILIVDDEKNMCTVLSMLFRGEGYDVACAGDGTEAIRRLEQGDVIDLIVSDLKMPGGDGLGILDFLKETERDIPLILITAYGTIPDAVQAVKKGAVDFITKPFNSEMIVHTVGRVFRTVELERSNRILSESIAEDRVVCESPQMLEIMALARKFAAAPTPVLIVGESGVGKEMIARAIHAHGCARLPGAERPFIIINCPAIPEALLESEMFGHQRGSFTGAAKDFKGKVLLADGGTLFLDEVGDLPPAIQPKLLRVLEDKSFQPVGSNTTVRVNARVICTTNQDLERRMAEGTFRRDLFYRINALTMRVPPLRDRKADIRPLTDYFLKKYSLEMKKEVRISDGVREAFQEYAWPGNVRELRNVVERAVVIVNSGAEIGLRDLPPDMFRGCRGAEPGPENRLETQERALILETLHQSGWNISRAAQTLGIPRGNLRYRIEKFGLAKGE